MVKCHICNDEYNRVGIHWSQSSSCTYPSLSEYERNLIEGLLMGDGWINGHYDNTPFFGIKMVNKEFLEWLDGELGILSTGVRLDKTAEESEKDIEKWKGSSCECKDVYRLRTRRLPDMYDLWEWYSSGEKVFPDKINTSRTALKMWYVSDGGLSETSTKITTSNEANSVERFVEQIEDETPIETISVRQGGNARSIAFIWDGTDQFFDYIGSPPPGFEYKWI